MIKTSPISVLWQFLLFLILFVYGLIEARSILLPIVFSGFLSLILMPVVGFIEKKGVASWLAISLSILMVVSLLGLGLYVLAVQGKSLLNDIPDLMKESNQFFAKMESKFYDTFGFQARDQFALVKENSSSIISSSSSLLNNAIQSTSSVISFLTLVPIYLIFILLSRNNIRQFLKKLGEKKNYDYLKVANEIKSMLYNYIGGLIIVVSIISLLNSVGLLVLGIDHALFLGILGGTLTVIPYVGILIGGSIPVIMAFLTKDSIYYPLGVIALIALVQFLEGNFITPKVMGSKIDINPLAAIIALLIGAAIWGIVGMIIAIPSVGILRIVLSHSEELKPYAILLATDRDKKEA